MRTRLLLCILAFFIHAESMAHGFTVGELRIGHPAARPTRPGQTGGGAYLSIENRGKQDDRLIAVSTPIAQSAAIHTMTMDGHVMKMREVDSIDIAAGTKVAMRPGDGYHLMLLGLKKALAVGAQFPLTLTFEKAGKVEVTVIVEDRQPDAAPPAAAHAH